MSQVQKNIFFILLFTVLLFLKDIALIAQDKQDNFRVQFIHIKEDNDFINLRGEGTDRLYTNGTRIELFYTKSQKRRFLTSLLIPINNDGENLYSIGISQLMFTPTNIDSAGIPYGDRPYAGLLFLNHTLISSDFINKQKLTTEIDIGVIGPNSFAKETQTWLHGLVNYQKPLGWGNQVNNDIVLNYQLKYEKLLLSPSNKFELIGLIEANAGTLYNKITTGLTFRAGNYNSYFSYYEQPGVRLNKNYINKNKKGQFYFYLRPTFTALMDNSALQGGMFTGRQSVYTISADDLNRFTMQFEYGIIFGINRCALGVEERVITPEYKNAITMQFGSFVFFIGL